ncbi:hypothetical protein GGR53DRAFT_9998 [Hypoxylon sp. FL1150]|nr:hypothetical protein GGR53DRAFT_9998 [Hypoxylon sp. FL1150]
MDLSSGRPPPRPNNSHGSEARGAPGGLEQQKLDLLGPAYVLEQTRQQQYSRRRIINAEELRASIIQQASDETSSGEEHGYGRRLFVIQGSPEEYLQVLRETLDIDPRFVEAHVSRRSYRPWVGRRRRQNKAGNATSFASFEFPELLASDSIPPKLATAIKRSPRQDSEDTVGKPPPHVICANGDVAVFCYASLWLSPKADVLFLDCPGRSQHSSSLENTPYRSSELNRASTAGEANEFRNDSFNNNNTNNQTAIFETLLYESLAEEWRENPDEDTLGSLIEDIAIHQWTEFFEALSTALGPGSAEATVMFWQMQKSLERNLSNSEFYNKSFHLSQSSSSSSSSSTTSDWESLLSRLGRQVELSRQLAPPSVTTIELPTTQPPQADMTTYGAPVIPPRNNNNKNTSSGSAEDKNQHALDRVSYMGGVLLPLSIVSSILSMSDPFGPGGSMFYVFWAVSVPLVLVTVFVVYADTIRKAEVWIEVAASGGGGSDVENPEDLDHGHDHDHEHNGAATYSETVQLPVVEPKTNRVLGMAEFGDEYGSQPGVDGSFDEPSLMARKTFRTRGPGGRRKWQKQQLGWKGACMTAFQLYRLKKGRPPNWAGNVRRERTN